MNNLKGHSLLANVIKEIKKDKKQQANKVSFRLKESLFKKLKESMIEDQLLRELPKKKLILIENLLAE